MYTSYVPPMHLALDRSLRVFVTRCRPYKYQFKSLVAGYPLSISTQESTVRWGHWQCSLHRDDIEVYWGLYLQGDGETALRMFLEHALGDQLPFVIQQQSAWADSMRSFMQVTL